MALSEMIKVVVAGSSTELDTFMLELQHAAIFHVTAIVKKSEFQGENTDSGRSGRFSSTGLSKLVELKEFLENFREKESLWVRLFAPLKTIRRDNFYSAVKSFDADELISKSDVLRSRIDDLKEEKKILTEINSSLELWRDVTVTLDDAGESGESFTAAGFISSEKTTLISEIPGIDWQILMQDEKKTALILACHKSDRGSLDELMQAAGFDKLDVSILKGSPRETYKINNTRIAEIERALESARVEGVKLLEYYDNLLLAVEHLGNMEILNRAFRCWTETQYSFIASGWIMKTDIEKFSRICGMFDAVEFDVVDPVEGEMPPVALKNRTLFSPFQLLTRLYGYPAYGSYDPSAVTSVFFAVFFAICMTDAVYGFILAVLAFIGLLKLKWKSDILWIAFWGGLFTIAAGLLTGGILGDLFRRNDPFIHITALYSFREFFLWFDPMIEPMIFFRLVLLLGVIHVLTGLAIGAAAMIRQGRIADALFDNVTWLVIIISLLTILFASELSVRMALVSGREPLLAGAVIFPAAVSAGIAAASVILFGGRDEKSIPFRLFIGILKLLVLSGVFSYVGDILSYIRLMALGMVTSGIATAINTIAYMMIDIPVAGILLTALVLAAGHTFNMAIGILGGFVHTLRLQYVEFYSKFFSGGGVPFEPLSLNSRYVKIID